VSKGDSKKFAIGALIGATAGIITGILTAPKSGKETRKDIKDTASKVFAEAEKKLKSLYSELGELIDKGNQELKVVSGKAQQELEKALSAGKEAQAKAKEVISAIRSGETANPELQQAIKDVTKAKDHLKKYLKG
jgi:gas vesicle protein